MGRSKIHRLYTLGCVKKNKKKIYFRIQVEMENDCDGSKLFTTKAVTNPNFHSRKFSSVISYSVKPLSIKT